MPDYAEVAGVASAYANGMGHQSHTSTSPLYDSCGAYATTSLIGTTNIYHQNRYDTQQQAELSLPHSHYNNVIHNGPFVYPNKKTSSTSLNTPKMDGERSEKGGDKLNNTFGGNRNNTLSYGIRNRLMKMNITENKMDILINNNNLNAKGSLNGSCKSIQKPSAESVNPLPPPTPNLGSTRRNQFLAGNGGVGGGKMKKNLFPNEAPNAPPPPVMKSYLDPETDDDEEQDELDVGGLNGQLQFEGEQQQVDRSCDRVNGNGNVANSISSVNNNVNNNNNHNSNSTRSGKSQRQHLLAGDNNNQSLKSLANKNSSKSLNSSSSSSPYHMINHRRNHAAGPAANGDSSSTNGLNNGSGGGSSTSSPLMKKNFAGSDNQINGSPNYMKSFGKTDNV